MNIQISLLSVASLYSTPLIRQLFVDVAKKFSEDPYTYRSGWPDLIIVKGKEVKFIEVKTTDKLHKSQLVTIPTFRKIIPYDFSVCRVSR